MAFIGLDLGTSGLKGVLIDHKHKLLAEGTAPLTLSRPFMGWSEQAPADWIAATESVLDQLAAAHSLADVQAIGLSGQMHGATLLSQTDEVLRPSILWNDTRSHLEAAALDANPIFRATTGNIVFPGFTAPKIMWLATHEPELRQKIAKVLLPKDYLRFWLSGEYITDMSDASGTAWLDVAARDWSDALLAVTGLSRAHMPHLIDGNHIGGQLRPVLAKRWGMSSQVIIAGGAGDNAASAVAVGAVQAQRGFVSLGTSGVLFVSTDAYRPAAETAVHTFCHAIEATWHQMGVILSCTDSLTWLAKITGSTAHDLTAELEAQHTDSPSTPGAPLFLPYLGGERTPLNNSHIRGAFLGLDHADRRVQLTKSVLEGVSFALRDCRNALQATGTQFSELIAVGGGAHSTYWLQLLANVLECPIHVPVAGDYGAAFGAARLAQMAHGNASVTECYDLASAPKILQTYSPNPQLKEAFEHGYQRYVTARHTIGDLS